jgi:hypothetical protein
MIQKITRQIVWNGRKTDKTWFHPRTTRLPDGSVLMTCQDITGFDSFGPGHWSKTCDNGTTWSEPHPIAAFGRTDIGNGFEEGACDFVPEYHALSGKVLVIGDSAYYKKAKDAAHAGYNSPYTDPPEGSPARHPAYCVGDGQGNWGDRRELMWDDPRASRCLLCGCAQRVTLEDGDVLLPVYFASAIGAQPADHRYECSATTLRCSFDGERLALQEVGRELRLPSPNGFMEPSITRYKNTFYLTLRTWKHDLGYVTTSTDGLHWNDITPWKFDDGTTMDLSPTQQRWLTHSDGLFLVYTRKTSYNYNVFWWRAPLFVAQVDTEKMCLIRDSEQIVFPIDGNGTAAQNKVACMGNFHVVNASPQESWVTVGEARRHDLTHGDTLLARIHWEEPNRLV